MLTPKEEKRIKDSLFSLQDASASVIHFEQNNNMLSEAERKELRDIRIEIDAVYYKLLALANKTANM